MFGIGSSLFKSRWSALLWAAGILWTAWSFATDATHDNQEDAGSNADMAAVAKVL